MAKHLNQNGYKVTVVYLGDEHLQFDAVSAIYKKQGIVVTGYVFNA